MFFSLLAAADEGAAVVSVQMSSTNSNYSKCQQYHLHANCLFFYLSEVSFEPNPNPEFCFASKPASVGPADTMLILVH